MLMLSCLQAFAMPSEQNSITLSRKGATVSEILDAVEAQSGFIFVTSGTDLSMTRDINVKNAGIEEVLQKLFAGTPVKWTVSGVNVYLSTQSDAEASPLRQESTGSRAGSVVTGRILDPDGAPLPGASVIVDGTSTGVMAGPDGRFSLSGVRFPAKVTISFIGLEDLHMTFYGNEKDLAITLHDSANVLEDVVVVGYGTQRRVNVTGAVAVVDGKDLNNRPVTNTAIALQGADPGLLMTMGNGSIEGRNYTMRIRGQVSLNSGSPLVLIDGVEGNLENVNPNDIESVSILKDASACAIYGAKASAGVVLITTHSGTEGKTRVTYNGRGGVSTNTTSTDFITSAYDYTTLTNEFYNVLRGINAWTFTDEQMQMMYERRNDKTENPARPWVIPDETGLYTYVYLGNFDWYGYLFKRVRPETEHNVTISGGNEKVQYYTSARYLYREGVFNAGAEDIWNGFDVRSKIDAKVTPWLRSSTNISYERSKYTYGGFYEQDGNDKSVLENHSAFWNANQNISPAYVPFNPDGSINVQPGFMALNTSQLGTGRIPTWMDDRNRHQRTRGVIVLTQRFTFDIAKGLQLIADYTYRRRDNFYSYRSLPVSNAYDNVNKKFYAYPGYTSGAIYDFYKESRAFNDGSVANAYMQYKGSFGKHNLGGTAGVNFDDYRQSTLSVKQKGSLSESLAYINMANGEIEELRESNTSYRTLGVFGRVNYDYAGKYLLEVSARYDGSSRFPAKDRWGFFPSVSAGWRISEEPFWEPLESWWNKAKVRLSYGSLGNQQVDNYYYYTNVTTGNMSGVTFDGKEKAGYAGITSPKSDSLTWETVVSYNLGLDFGFLRDRLNISADAYIRDTKDMLTTSITLPSVYGATSPKENAADMRTKGYELSASWRDSFTLLGHKMSYGLTASFGDYKTVITRYNNPTKLLTDHYVGKTLGEIWGYHIEGLFASDEDAAVYAANIDDTSINNTIANCVAPHNKLMAGDVIFADLNGDGVISSGSNTVDDPGDRYIMGNTLPRYLYSVRGDFQWNGFDFNIFFQGVGHCDWYPPTNCDYFWQTYRNGRPSFISKKFESMCWSEDNPDAYFPRRRLNYAANSLKSSNANDRYLQNAAYLRLKNLTFGYTIPLKGKAIQKCRVYFSGENLAYWSPLKKHCVTIDPEVATTGAFNDTMYPFSRTFSLGVDITF